MVFIKIFVIGFFLNLLYEMFHSLLYTTCLQAPLKKYVYLMLKGGMFDALAIALIYYATNMGQPVTDFLGNPIKITVFIISAIIFAYLWEIYSLKKGKWEYSPSMPKILGAGVTPLVQLATTGITSIYLATYFQV